MRPTDSEVVKSRTISLAADDFSDGPDRYRYRYVFRKDAAQSVYYILYSTGTYVVK